jgi:hypothetical protein
MKRDLKKWLKSSDVEEFTNLKNIDEWDIKQICERIIEKSDTVSSYNVVTNEELIQFIWIHAQKQFLKNILDDIDEGLEKIYAGKNRVKNEKARIVREEEALKAWLYNKYKYLQRKNG